jgi:hypothetical protein
MSDFEFDQNAIEKLTKDVAEKGKKLGANIAIEEIKKIYCPEHKKVATNISIQNDRVHFDTCCEILKKMISEKLNRIILKL